MQDPIERITKVVDEYNTTYFTTTTDPEELKAEFGEGVETTAGYFLPADDKQGE